MRAIVLDALGEPTTVDLAEPDGDGERVDVLACGLCGSDVEKIGRAAPGTVLGHEVVARTADGRRVALIHHAGCGTCSRCLAGHESTCEQFPTPTIVPGGLAERVRAHGWVELPDGIDDAHGTYVEPLACVLRGVERIPAGRVLIVGHGFIGHLFASVLRHRGDEVFTVDADPRRAGRVPEGPVDVAVLSGGGGVDTALDALEPGGTLLVFADAGSIPAQRIYRSEITVVGVRSASPPHMEAAVGLLRELDVPEPTVLPLARFDDGLALFRSRDAIKVVFAP